MTLNKPVDTILESYTALNCMNWQLSLQYYQSSGLWKLKYCLFKLNFWNIACYILIYHLQIQKVLTLNTICFSVNLIHTQTQTFENLYSSCQRCVATALMYSCCYSYCYQCLVKSTANLDVINFNKIGMHEAFITPKRIPIMKVMQSLCP